MSSDAYLSQPCIVLHIFGAWRVLLRQGAPLYKHLKRLFPYHGREYDSIGSRFSREQLHSIAPVFVDLWVKGFYM